MITFGVLVSEGIMFDDVTTDEHGTWSQICKDCATKHNIKKGLREDEGYGICGVMGCTNEADHYIDFDDKES